MSPFYSTKNILMMLFKILWTGRLTFETTAFIVNFFLSAMKRNCNLSIYLVDIFQFCKTFFSANSTTVVSSTSAYFIRWCEIFLPHSSLTEGNISLGLNVVSSDCNNKILYSPITELRFKGIAWKLTDTKVADLGFWHRANKYTKQNRTWIL